MPEPIFEHPRLVAVYDSFDGRRGDLEHYLAIAKECGARSVLDVGCGTGCFAHLLAGRGYDVIGLEPARASLDFALSKPGGDRIRWILGEAKSLPPLAIDLAVMTGNVAQVFVTDQAWEENLRGIRHALCPNGLLVFEVRDPAKQAWLDWTKEKTWNRLEIHDVGIVESWCDVISAEDELVSLRWTYIFQSDGAVITSDSTLRFRSQSQIKQTLQKSGYVVNEVRDAPDRPGKEFVFLATATPH